MWLKSQHFTRQVVIQLPRRYTHTTGKQKHRQGQPDKHNSVNIFTWFYFELQY